ncbi:MAG: hypothetical protein LKG56_09040 [Lachnospiraceae bacterium]|jgi:hypothetical protein|nr:hypothetical protein [Lachnospiraceae bacterium]MCH4069921.1 hypothetical protein [Lachnospiraceae bacterium]MCH4107857.1 hypothetical protein [Lachnospiraceae bacterium]MCI1332414.1 hypothetical protein [Lachnospiraceae bacterium]MCI1361801.1 hypothetical protein [Lachnospiraceae bacterium]
MKSPANIIQRLKERIRLDKKTFLLYSVLRALVILSAVRCFLMQNYEGLALCILSLILFLLPAFFEAKMKVDIPPLFEGSIYLFIYAAEILGEVNHYYTLIPGWDTMLHTINGFLCAAIGFSMVELLNRSSRRISLSPLYLAVVAFCFSMTIGVCWEFIEFTADQLFFLDMQKDTIVQTIGSVTLDPTHSQIPVKVSDIVKTVIYTASGDTVTVEGGYLDIGIIDTMKDLFVNFIGAITFSVIGYFYESKRGKRTAKIAQSLILRKYTDEELEQQEKDINQRMQEIRDEREARRKGRRREI